MLPGGTDIIDTGVRVIVPTKDSPVKGDNVIDIKAMKAWLSSKGLKSTLRRPSSVVRRPLFDDADVRDGSGMTERSTGLRKARGAVALQRTTKTDEGRLEMDFAFSESQQHWYDATLRFAREELVEPESNRGATPGGFWREGYARCARFGIPGLPVLAEFGGRGQDLPTTVAAMEALGYGCTDSGMIFGLNAALWTVTMPIAQFGSEEQKRRYLPGLCDGSLLGANGASEPEAGSDIFAMRTRAERRGDGWVLNGRKIWITAGPIADLYLCFATTDPSRGILGISTFLVDAMPRGFAWWRDPQDGDEDGAHGRARFEDCRLPRAPCWDAKAAGPRSSTPAWSWSGGPSSPSRSARCADSSTVASSTRGRGNNSASRSASSSPSRTGSST